MSGYDPSYVVLVSLLKKELNIYFRPVFVAIKIFFGVSGYDPSYVVFGSLF